MGTLFLIVGLPGAGKTRRAVELANTHSCLRLTPDEWMAPLFGEPEADGKRDVLEGRLIWVALEVLQLGSNVILDFGLWSRNERSALRWLARSVGATAAVIYLPIDTETQRGRLADRRLRGSSTTFRITDAELDTYRAHFEVPTSDELTGAELDEPPSGGTWRQWAAERWPSFAPR